MNIHQVLQTPSDTQRELVAKAKARRLELNIDISSPETTPLLHGLCRRPDQREEEKMEVLRLWTLDMDKGELCSLRDFPLRSHQFFYAHSVGCCSVNVPCPPELAEQVRNVLKQQDWNGRWDNASKI